MNSGQGSKYLYVKLGQHGNIDDRVVLDDDFNVTTPAVSDNYYTYYSTKYFKDSTTLVNYSDYVTLQAENERLKLKIFDLKNLLQYIVDTIKRR
jgi:hypothetical protein